MIKLALNFICKNESHVILKMLDSVRPITDLIVAVDTGSTDNTIELIKKFGLKNSIPTFVYTRTFDDFCNSRNYALDMLHQVVRQLEWPEQETFGFFIDCDEKMVVSDQFSKEQIKDDLYIVAICGGHDWNVRQLFFRLCINYWWEGPIHETLVGEKTDLSPKVIKEITIFYEKTGASWKGDLEHKFLERAKKLTHFVEEGNGRTRWIAYIGDSYAAAAEYCPSKSRKKALKNQAKQYYEKALSLNTITTEKRISLLYRAGETIKESDWKKAQEFHLQAFEIDHRRAESLAAIIEHYMFKTEWEMAYLFSFFAKKAFHLSRHVNLKRSGTDDSLYRWKLLMYHAVCCQQSSRRQEAKELGGQLKKITQLHPELFDQNDLIAIRLNSPTSQAIRNSSLWLKKKLKRLLPIRSII